MLKEFIAGFLSGLLDAEFWQTLGAFVGATTAVMIIIAFLFGVGGIFHHVVGKMK